MAEQVGPEQLLLAEKIGTQFCGQYYSLFDANREDLASLYTDVSVMSFEGDVRVGNSRIMQKLLELPFKVVKHVATAIDSHPTVDGSILISVLGQVKTDDDQPKPFHQTFLLKNSGGNFFVLNDIFRLSLHNF